MKQKFGKRIC